MCVASRDIEEMLQDMPNFDMATLREQQLAMKNIRRRTRQRNTFAAAIRARLAPPAPPRKRVHTITVADALVGFHRTDGGASECTVYYPTCASMSRVWRVVATLMHDISSETGRMKTFVREVHP
jgi:hypothetical protein